jgi:hypothetical protein
MEFFKIVDVRTTEKAIQKKLTLGNLEEFCESIFPLAWTITTGYPPAREKIIVHLTINRERKQEEFVEEIQLFLEDLGNGIASYFS